jgi:hypothetical protein
LTKANNDRASRAENALKAFADGADYDTDPESVLTDLITDLLHLADQKGLRFDDCLQLAKGHFKEESRA